MTGATLPTAVEQVEIDGTISIDVDPPQVPFEEQEDIIRNALQGRGWTVAFQQSDKSTKRRLFAMDRGGKSFHVITYIFSNLSWSNGNRSHDEKRIQLTRPYSEHAEDFNRGKDKDPRPALMGIYRRKGVVIFCAWDPAAFQGHANPTSCYVRTKAMSSAARTGLGQAVDSKGRLVVCFTPDLLAYYLENMEFLHNKVVASGDLTVPAPESAAANECDETPPDLPDMLPMPESLAHNRLVYGAPGTGKSHRVNDDLATYFPSDFLFERTTFYPDTTNGKFVGEYRPSPTYRRVADNLVGPDRMTEIEGLEAVIDYRFVPGPFLRALVRAHHHKDLNFALVIEEINRAHASAVFGEVFQMLDRDDEGAGKYSVALTAAARDYLAGEGLTGPVRIPKNLYIWATMNSADQGVYPLDAAFRRRWTLEYVGLNEHEEVIADWEMKLRFLDDAVKWNFIRTKINSHLQQQGVAEDRLLGPFFMTRRELQNDAAFENKLLQYLRDDVVRSSPAKLFRGESLSYGALISAYRAGNDIFQPEVGVSGP